MSELDNDGEPDDHGREYWRPVPGLGDRDEWRYSRMPDWLPAAMAAAAWVGLFALILFRG